jgi:RND family efflux transporter MFP subunit
MLVKNLLSKIVLLLILVLLVVLVFFTLNPRSVQKTTGPGSEKGVALVEAARVVRGNLEPLFSSLGSIEPRQQANVFSLVTGQVDKILVKTGDKVQVGDVLAIINSSKVEEELKEVEAELEFVKATPVKAQENVGAPNQQPAIGDSSKDGVLQALQVRKLLAKEARLRQNINDYTLRAPISGIVTKKRCNAGDTVAALGTQTATEPLFVIEEIESVYAQAGIPEKFISQIQVRMKAKVRVGAYPLEHFPLAIFQGEIVRINPTINTKTRTVDIWVEIPNKEGKLRPGMSSEVGLVIEQYKDRLLIPKEAVVKADEATIVFVIEDKEAIAQGKTSPVIGRGVNLGLGDGVNYIVEDLSKAGTQEREIGRPQIQEGDLVVTVGAAGLADDQLVRVVR